MKINIVLPYPQAGKYYERWASEEMYVDFENAEAAAKCTVSFACLELVTYLQKIGHEASVSDSQADGKNIVFEFGCDDSESFEYIVSGDSLTIKAGGRRGILYGVYELLEAQGVRWFAPADEFVPSGAEFVIPEKLKYSYALPYCRGFHFEDLMNQSKAFLLWMARNRLNIHACHSHLKAFQQKICMKFETGGHIFEKILNPMNITDDGRYYIDAHKDWYGQREEGVTADNALLAQFCVSNEELLDHLADTVIRKLNNEWKNENIFSLDGFDTWGKSCQCEKCKKVGNSTDQTLKFLSHIRKRINEAQDAGVLRKGINLSFCAYEGTATLEPPTKPVPQNLIDAGDTALYAPILRCYRHHIYEECERNNNYKKTLEQWVKTGINVRILEYYNVSKYEELPLVLTDKIAEDVRYYEKIGVSGSVYMHVFVKEWGVRALNHYLYAKVCRDPECDAEAVKKEYFERVYGKSASEAEKAYKEIEEATSYIASWRAWFEGSVLTYLMNWDGGIPEKGIDCDSHLKGRVVEEGNRMLGLLKSAYGRFRKIKEDVLSGLTTDLFPANKPALNPVEQAKAAAGTRFIDKISEDIRGLSYGIDVFELMTLFADYYDALYEKRNDADAIFEKIRVLAERMSEYTYSVTFASYEPEFDLRDALKRSQLKELYYRCVARRNEQ